ncbi:hypothetical protein P152DRAFT_426221 [Eremomyces bilateralis CBS 781.70]|uniref:Zn(2)-C6 fungal-type domain-containing protein n=1 Tax=Eremomyces bilateralis CBS 781.70 TaxID=1392243 RepID=A0A6G1GFH7_9PEZI|nr:uncharacterized protein P152DRAFT_426221 [Eremomyces bilateralis CBS 781.70]KAF1816865.1 hypothetical protein P152DRAFT_426221 [Eremomyces bilateralis CBS 781.70]
MSAFAPGLAISVRTLPPLRPAGPRETPSPSAAVYRYLPVSNNIIRRKRETTTSACEACRKRKSKCNAQRPRCTRCTALDTTCEYQANAAETHAQALRRKFSDLKETKTAYEEIYELLQNRPPSEAQNIYLRIRQGSKAEEILHDIHNSDLLLRLSSNARGGDVTTSTGSNLMRTPKQWDRLAREPTPSFDHESTSPSPDSP